MVTASLTLFQIQGSDPQQNSPPMVNSTSMNPNGLKAFTYHFDQIHSHEYFKEIQKIVPERDSTLFIYHSAQNEKTYNLSDSNIYRKIYPIPLFSNSSISDQELDSFDDNDVEIKFEGYEKMIEKIKSKILDLTRYSIKSINRFIGNNIGLRIPLYFYVILDCVSTNLL